MSVNSDVGWVKQSAPITTNYSSDFPTTDTYDTFFNRDENYDVFVSRFDSDLSAPPPIVTTGSATNVSLISATLNGTVNANNSSPTAWFEYGTNSGSYTHTTSTASVSGERTIRL